MKAAALAFFAAASSFALLAASPAQTYDQKVGGTTSIKPHEQQAQLGPIATASATARICKSAPETSRMMSLARTITAISHIREINSTTSTTGWRAIAIIDRPRG